MTRDAVRETKTYVDIQAVFASMRKVANEMTCLTHELYALTASRIDTEPYDSVIEEYVDEARSRIARARLIVKIILARR